MKIKSLLIGMLACTALVGCSDDVIESITPENENPQSALVRGDAYLNFVINTATNSSRGGIDGGAEGNVNNGINGTTGDSHGSINDSNHKNDGTDLDNKIEEILLVIAKADETSEENGDNDNIILYNSSASDETGNNTDGSTVNNKVRNGYVGIFKGNTLLQPEDKNYVSLASPIRLDYTGKYAVLVVVNPAADLGIKDGDDAKTAYEKILSHAGEAYTTENGKITSFQMSNKYGCLIDATGHDTPNNPVVAEIKVERTVSKATWRWSEANDIDNIPDNLKDKYNVYPIAINLMNYNASTKPFWYKTEMTDEGGNTYYAYHWIAALNQATDKSGNIYWVHFIENGNPNFDAKGQVIFDQIQAIFKGNNEGVYDKYKGVLDNAADSTKDDTNTTEEENNNTDDKEQTTTGTEKEDNLLPEASNSNDVENRLTKEFVQGLTFVYDGNVDEDDSQKYYVHLTHYTLTNLSPSVYTVRHIDNGKEVREFGNLESNEYLCTPFYNHKYYGEGADENFTNYFTNSLAAVNTATSNWENERIPNSFNPLPGYEGTVTSEGSANDVLAEGETPTNHNNKDVGALMEYLYENSCKADDYNPNFITGLVLAGDIYDNTGAKVPVLYQFNQKYYRTMQRLLDDNRSLATSKNLTPNSTKTEIEAAGIEVFENGRCFYYGSGIKHYQYAPEVTTEHYMEYAIMRNNIYSLAVTGIEGIGDARLNVTEDTPIEDIRSYVSLQVSIIPWIVRFNDIDF